VLQGSLVDPSGGSSVPTAVLVHGILGSRRNLQGFARMIVEVRPWETASQSPCSLLARLCRPRPHGPGRPSRRDHWYVLWIRPHISSLF
jgi:hypothetical protein